jgi:hypothetical protein
MKALKGRLDDENFFQGTNEENLGGEAIFNFKRENDGNVEVRMSTYIK